MVVLLVGCGPHALHYAKVLRSLGTDYVVVGRGEASAKDFERTAQKTAIRGGLDAFLKGYKGEAITECIVCLPVSTLVSASLTLINFGIKRLLVEKPAGINAFETYRLADAASKSAVQVYVAYNRRYYASVQHAKKIIEADGGVTSYEFNFTEWTNTFSSHSAGPHLFVANSSHVIDLAFFLGGFPSRLNVHSAGLGEVEFFPGPSRWTGSGESDNGALFSYQADWTAPGRWSVTAYTRKNKIVLCPLEKAQGHPHQTVSVQQFDSVDYSLDKNFKPGLYSMVDDFLSRSSKILAPTIQDHHKHMKDVFEVMRGPRTDGPVIAIVGCGNIGIRHLQAALKLDSSCQIYAVEPQKNAAKLIWDASVIISGHEKHSLTIVTDTVGLPAKLDICVIATTSEIRLQVLRDVLSCCAVKYCILEKVLFQTEADHLAVMDLLQCNNVICAVNTCHRLQWYVREVKNSILKDQLVSMSVDGDNWGLCCNVVHFLDTFMFVNDISGDDVSLLQFDTSNLEDFYAESKRRGFFELFGTLRISYQSVTLSVTCHQKLGGPHSLRYSFDSPKLRACADVTNGLFEIQKEENEMQSSPLKMSHVSTTSTWVMRDFILHGKSNLSTYEAIAQASIYLNNALSDYFVQQGLEQAAGGLFPCS